MCAAFPLFESLIKDVFSANFRHLYSVHVQVLQAVDAPSRRATGRKADRSPDVYGRFRSESESESGRPQVADRRRHAKRVHHLILLLLLLHFDVPYRAIRCCCFLTAHAASGLFLPCALPPLFVILISQNANFL